MNLIACFGISAIEALIILYGGVTILLGLPSLIFIIGDLIFEKGKNFIIIIKDSGKILGVGYLIVTLWVLVAEYIL